MTLPPPWVDPETVPELAAVLRAGLLAKVRVFSGWCERGDRLVQAVRVAGRPLALWREAAEAAKPAHRSVWRGMWLDVEVDLYRPPHPPILGAQCRHENAPIPGWWIRRQVEAGTTARVIDAATRREMGVRPRGA